MTWTPDPKVPERYRRMTGSEKRPELAGKKVPRECKSCIWWQRPYPTVSGKKGTQHDASPCSVAYFKEPDKGPTPPSFRCAAYTHMEHLGAVESLSELPQAQLAVMPSIASMLEKVRDESHPDTLWEAFKFLCSQHTRVLNEVVKPLAGDMAKSKREKVDVKLKHWYLIDTGERPPFEALAVKQKSNGIEFVPTPRANLGFSYTLSYDQFEKCAQLVTENLEDMLAEDDL
jgi:hypothetical protein